MPAISVGGAAVFVMPGPYEAAGKVAVALEELATRL
jgi:hypothetical protein